MRLIDADAVKKAFEDESCGFDEIKIKVKDIMDLIDNVPTVKPSKGKWEMLPPCFEEVCYCTNCHKRFKQRMLGIDICPNCGAFMG